jgi:hypothetical protein
MKRKHEIKTTDLILKSALLQIQNNINVDGLCMVLEKTNNSQLAFALISGQYVAPEIVSETWIDGKKYFFESFNMWDDRVNCYSIEKDIEKIYIYKDDVEKVTISNYHDFEVPWSKREQEGVITHEIDKGRDRKNYNYFPLGKWNDVNNCGDL